jgi:ankyrin repeat protein
VQSLKHNQQRLAKKQEDDSRQSAKIKAFTIHEECRYQCRSSIILQCIELFPQSLAQPDEDGYLPLHNLLENQASSIDDALMLVEKYPAALHHQNVSGNLPLHVECKSQCRPVIISKCIELYPESLSVADHLGYLPLHVLLENNKSSVEQILNMIDKFPAALRHINKFGNLFLHLECGKRCRSAIISRCIELYPGALAVTGRTGYLPLHTLLGNKYSATDDAQLMIDKYPAALEHQNSDEEDLPIHIECKNQCRSKLISRCIELFPEALSKANGKGDLPLHVLLRNKSSTSEDALIMIETYPEALRHQNDDDGQLPLHIECMNQCRALIISKCFEIYPESLAQMDDRWYQPLHLLLSNEASSIDSALTMIKQHPEALSHPNTSGQLPLHIECARRCRFPIISRCIELYPQALDDRAVSYVMEKVNVNNFLIYSSVVSIIFTALPMSLYKKPLIEIDDIRMDPTSRRRILHLLPRHVFTPTHDADYRDLNWQPRTAMMMLLAQLNFQNINIDGDSRDHHGI